MGESIRPRSGSRSRPAAALPVARAGEDSRGFAGQVTRLDGSQSEPRGQIGLRWIQIAGPQSVHLRAEGTARDLHAPDDRVYRFLLVVGAGSMISEPDLVEVRVDPAPPPPIEVVARRALGSVEGGAEIAESLARVFNDLAERMSLYTAYADLFSEMSRRIDAVIPGEPGRRRLWSERVFVPLSASIIESLRAEGLDLTSRDGPNAP